MSPKLPKFDLTTGAEYVVNFNMSICGCKHVTLQLITRACYSCITTFFSLMS